MYGWKQECARKETLRVETEDLEKRLAEIYGGIEGGVERCADLTAPRGASQKLSVGAVPTNAFWAPRVNQARRNMKQRIIRFVINYSARSDVCTAARMLLTTGAVKATPLLTYDKPPQITGKRIAIVAAGGIVLRGPWLLTLRAAGWAGNVDLWALSQASFQDAASDPQQQALPLAAPAPAPQPQYSRAIGASPFCASVAL